MKNNKEGEMQNNNGIVLRTTSKAQKLYNKFGATISSFASQKSIDEDILGGLILTETQADGFENGRLIIRFENHHFIDKVDGASSIFKIDGKTHYYLKNGIWKMTHDGQDNEYEAFELAKGLNEYYAYYSISMGLGQIMGFNCNVAGYETPKDMYNAFCISESVQMYGFLNFVANYKNTKYGKLIDACKNRDFTLISCIYNGDASYSGNLKQYTAEYASIL